MNACLTIGGPIFWGDVAGLCKAIQRDGCLLDWNEAFEPNDEADLTAALNPAGELVLTDPDARWGKFESVEDYCRSHGIAFDRHTDAKYEYNGEMGRFRPGDDEYEDEAHHDR